jgi:hypothetical protein
MCSIVMKTQSIESTGGWPPGGARPNNAAKKKRAYFGRTPCRKAEGRGENETERCPIRRLLKDRAFILERGKAIVIDIGVTRCLSLFGARAGVQKGWQSALCRARDQREHEHQDQDSRPDRTPPRPTCWPTKKPLLAARVYHEKESTPHPLRHPKNFLSDS